MQRVHQRHEIIAFAVAHRERFNGGVRLDPLTTAVVVTLSIAGTDSGGLSPALLRRLVDEAQAIWRRADVDVRLVARRDAATHRPDVYVYVDALRAAGAPASTEALAWIVFMEGRPSNRIFVSCAAARALIERDVRVGAPFRALPPTGRERMLARVLGRALAHEIGHYLSASAEHSATGLMRATQSIAALATDDSKAFTVHLPHRTVSRTEVSLAEDCSLLQSYRSALP